MSLVHDLEEILLPRLNQYAANLQHEFPDTKIEVFSYSIGSLTSIQGHALGIDCLLPEGASDAPDNVALVISLRHLTTEPYMDADVCGGAPIGHVEIEYSPEPIVVTEVAIAGLERDLPR